MAANRNNRGAGDAWSAALRLLARRDYAIGELRQRLLAKGYPAEAIEAALARGVELGYLDDVRHIERLSRTLLASGRAAGRRLALELRRRGLPDDLVGEAVAAARDDGSEDEALRDLIARRFPSFAFAAADEREQRRVVAYLQRRGFPLDRILNELKRTDS